MLKRCFIISALMLSLLSCSLLFFIYFFDINEYRPFISKQIERFSGYQIHFEAMDSRLLADATVALSGLSLRVDNQQVFYVDKMQADISKVDLWHRQLTLGSVQLTGINISGDLSTLLKAAEQNVEQTEGESQPQKLPWQRLTIDRLAVNDLNIDITDQERRLVAEGVDFSTTGLLIIEEQQLLTRPLSGNLKLRVRELTADQGVSDRFRVNNLQLMGSFDVNRLQANLDVTANSIDLALSGQEKAVLHNSELVVELDKNTASINSFSTKMFSGELQLQAQALFSIKPLSAPFFSVQQLTVQLLSIKNMELVIPALFSDAAEIVPPAKNHKQPLPIQNLFLQKLLVENTNISSANAQIPLLVKNLNSSVLDFALLENNKLGGLAEENTEAGSFTLQFDYLQWMESSVEQLQISGKLSKNDQSVLLLQQLLGE